MAKTNGGIDTSKERRSAVRKAWTKERQLVRQGQGTRDWTPEQQKDILDRKTPKDEQGRPYEGHHMVSVANNKELAGDPDNIQFLTHDEHIKGAHQGNTKNATEGYYDPDSKKMTNVNDKDYRGPTPKELTNPVYTREASDGKETDKTASQKNKYKDKGKGEETGQGNKPAKASTEAKDPAGKSADSGKASSEAKDPTGKHSTDSKSAFAESAKSTGGESQSGGSASSFAESAKSNASGQTSGSSQSASNFAESAKSTGSESQSSSQSAAASQSSGQGKGGSQSR